MKRIFFGALSLLLVLSMVSCIRPSTGYADDTTAVKETTGISDTSDTTVADTTVSDTTVSDTTVNDTTANDTTANDTTANDTTANDTTVNDTTANDTTVSDTTVNDTTASDTTAQTEIKDSVQVTYPVEQLEGTFTGLAPLSQVEYTVNDPLNLRGLSDERIAFSYGVAKDGAPHSITVNNQSTFDAFGTNGLAWDNKTEKKVLYLTFDCGYKYGDLTSRILDTLKEKGVKAAFFCTMDYLEEDPAEIARMIEEGHTVGNHSVNHPDCTTVSREELARELLGVHNYMRANFGYSPEYFRFPTGAFSEDVLDLVNGVGYKSVFWSVAYADWDPENQIGEESAFAQVSSRLHPGAVILLHSTSPDNAAILSRLIDYARGEGYEFSTLDDYGYWK